MNEKRDYITISRGMSGYYAIHIWWNPEGFCEPWNAGGTSYNNPKLAINEGRDWADSLGLEFRPMVEMIYLEM